MNAMQLSQSIQFLDDLLFWVQCPDEQTTKQNSWCNATLTRMEELLVNHAAYRSISPKIRRLIHTLNGNPLPEFLRGSFLEVEKIRDDLRNELNHVDKQAAIAAEQEKARLEKIRNDGKQALITSPVEQTIDLIVGKKFLNVYKPKPKPPQKRSESQNVMADTIESSVNENEWLLFKTSRGINKDKRAYFYRLIQDCDVGKCPKWLESLK